jgi:hypothetical protein
MQAKWRNLLIKAFTVVPQGKTVGQRQTSTPTRGCFGTTLKQFARQNN